VEPDGSLPCSQEPATGPCPKSRESSPQLQPYFSKIYSNTTRATYPTHFILFDLITLTIFILFGLISLTIFRDAPHYAVFSSLPSQPPS